jgi:hypothetical protein
MERTQPIRGFAYGVAATIAMSLVMAAGAVSEASPIPEPVPKAVVTALFGLEGPPPLVAALAVGLHLAYGGAFGALLATVARPVTLARGLGVGVTLWLLMGVAFLPALGWGTFGTAVSPRVAVATLALHLVYGAVIGWTLGRDGGRAAGAGAATAD